MECNWNPGMVGEIWCGTTERTGIVGRLKGRAVASFGSGSEEGKTVEMVVMHLDCRRFRKDPLLFAVHIVLCVCVYVGGVRVCACSILKFIKCGLV